MDQNKKQKMKVSLETAINKWADEVSESGEWIDGYVTGQTSRIMADAAMAVLEATDETQAWLQEEGVLTVS